MESFLFQATIYLGAAVIAVPLAARLGLGSVLGYLAAGIVIGPVLGLVGSETESLQHFAEFGVVMMLFLIGLELEPRALWDMRDRLLGLGGLQLGLTTGLIWAGAMLLGFNWSVSLAIGLIFALSSTAIVLQTLQEKGLMQSQGGRSTFSVLLAQDIAVIPMLAFLPLLALPFLTETSDEAGSDHGSENHGDSHAADTAGHGADHSGGHGDAAMSLVDGLPAWGVTLVTLGAIAFVILAGIFLIRPLFRWIDHANLRELYTAFSLLLVVGIAVLMGLVGLSPALGTFLAGVVLANSEFRHELESDLEPFKGLLLGLFFITVGAGINFGVLFGDPFSILALTLAVIAIKAGVLYALALLFKLQSRDKILFTLSLAQAGEFGFVLVSFALQQSVIPTVLSERLLLIIALSMLITPLLFILYDQLASRLNEELSLEADEIDDKQGIIIAGIGRFGQVVNRLLQMAGMQATVIDKDLETINLMRTFGFKAFLGDPTRPDMLHAAGIHDAKVLVVTLDDKEDAVQLVKHARKAQPDLHIVARAYDRVHTYQLYQAGANDIVREMFDSSLRAGRYVLEQVGLTDYEAAMVRDEFFKLDRAALAELAQLWDPDVPIAKNEAYVARAKQMGKDFENALLERMGSDAPQQLEGTAQKDGPADTT
ncbi:MAG: cation:proton antiporter [Pseudomonadota bacterium]